MTKQELLKVLPKPIGTWCMKVNCGHESCNMYFVTKRLLDDCLSALLSLPSSDKTYEGLIGILRAYCGEAGASEGAVDTLLRLEDELLKYRRGNLPTLQLASREELNRILESVANYYFYKRTPSKGIEAMSKEDALNALLGKVGKQLATEEEIYSILNKKFPILNNKMYDELKDLAKSLLGKIPTTKKGDL
jgi:hypothetical protein